MTRSLYLLRHGKSDWGAEHAGDHERPLKKRGRRAAQRVGELLAAAGEAPQLVLTSSAVRARTTIELAAEAGGWDAPVEVVADLYEAPVERLLAAARGARGGVERLLLCGHEPTLSETVAALCGGRPPVFPTAAVARIDLELDDWTALRAGAGRLAWLVPPRLIG